MRCTRRVGNYDNRGPIRIRTVAIGGFVSSRVHRTRNDERGRLGISRVTSDTGFTWTHAGVVATCPSNFAGANGCYTRRNDSRSARL